MSEAGTTPPLLRRAGRVIGRAVLVVLALLLVAAAAGAVWLAEGIEAADEPFAEVVADPDVDVVDGDGDLTIVRPAGADGSTVIVFYPGARIERDAYVATWAPIVEATGVEVIIPGMPINLAFLDQDRVEDIRRDRPDVERWVLGGHSMGGFAAVDHLVDDGTEGFAGLVLWASGAPPNEQVPELDLPILTVAGELDTVVPLDAVEASAQQLSATADVVVIPGMTHSQFGRYGVEATDRGRPDPETLDELVDAVTSFLADVG